jgi:threonine/homoserine/homoserine lactone efflux protein
MPVHNILSGYPSDTSLFLISAFMGFAAALPLGPVSILTIQRALTLGFWRAFWPSFGAIAATGVLGIIAALGSGFITSFILGNSFWLKLLGSLLLMAMGAKLLTLQPINRQAPNSDFESYQLTTLNFAFILSNPLTLAFFMAAFTFMGFRPQGNIASHSMVVGTGITFGTLVWYASICGVASSFHQRLGDSFLNRARAGVGGLFIVIAILSAASVLMAG